MVRFYSKYGLREASNCLRYISFLLVHHFNEFMVSLDNFRVANMCFVDETSLCLFNTIVYQKQNGYITFYSNSIQIIAAAYEASACALDI